MSQKLETVGDPTNDAARQIAFEEPYIARLRVTGSAALIFHRWSVDGIECGSYVYRNDERCICVPGEYFRQSAVTAAKFLQDPRSPRKSAMDLFKAGIVVLDELCSLGSKEWDYLDRRRVTIQRAGITRTRPAFKPGWQAEFTVQVLVPEYISPDLLNETFQRAGRLIGVGDMRPTFGRFQVTSFEAVKFE